MLDRRTETEALDRLLDAVRTGRSQALVLRGDAGIGKTLLLEYLVEHSSAHRVERATGIQAESELAFAALHQLCAPMLGWVDGLPGPQRDALHVAFGLSSGPAPDRFLVGLAVLGLLSEVASERALVCVVDDAQWLDQASAQALAFVARRLVAESVALVFAVRPSTHPTALDGLPVLEIHGLSGVAARELLDSVLPGPMDDRVRDRILAETRGNPLALLELPKALTRTELAEGFSPALAQPLPRQIERTYQDRLARLDAETSRLLLVAAVEPLGDPVLLWRAAELLGISVTAAAPATEAGLMDIDTRVRFRHPLVRSAIYRAASPEDRRRAHWALAEVTDPDADPDRRAWHAAQATAGPDDDVAAELERRAGRAQARGGFAAAAAFLERAAELSVGPEPRARRALAAAQAMHEAGSPVVASRLLSLADAGPLDKLARAQVELLRGHISLTVNRGKEAPPLLLNAARQLETLDVALARETYLDALLATMFAGTLATGATVRAMAEAARSAPPAPDPPRCVDLLLDGLAVRFTDGYAAALPILRRALAAYQEQDLSPGDLRWLWLAHIMAGNMWDEQTMDTERHLRLVRDSGALTTLQLALTSRIGSMVYAGELTAAEALCMELLAAAEATGIPAASYGPLLLAAWRGREVDASTLIETTTAEVLRRGEGFGLTIIGSATAVLNNSLGRYEEALTAARSAAEQPPVMGVEPWLVLVELIEAATRRGRGPVAAEALDRLTDTTQASHTDWALGLEARSRALLSQGPAAEAAYQEAMERLGRTRVRGEYARALLLYGEWLRRERRRMAAREQLRTAYEMFTAMGMEAFAQRTARELRATGETARKRTVETGAQLTPQETQIVTLVREGLSNSEIGARLFISPRTVEWHLGRIYDKLHITSRRQLVR